MAGMPESEAGTLKSLQLKTEPSLSFPGGQSTQSFSPQLWQIGHLHKLHTTILVSDGLHLATLQKRRSYALCQPGDDGHQLLLVIAAVEHQGFSPNAVLLLLWFQQHQREAKRRSSQLGSRNRDEIVLHQRELDGEFR